MKAQLIHLCIEQGIERYGRLPDVYYTKSSLKLYTWDEAQTVWLRMLDQFVCVLQMNDDNKTVKALERIPIRNVESIVQRCETCSQ